MIKDFWKSIYSNKLDVSFQNESIDVFVKDCYYSNNIPVCIGNLFLFLLGICTFWKCISHILEFHRNCRSGFYHFIIFFSATLEVFCLIIKWQAFVRLYQLEFVASLMKMVQFVTLCYLKCLLVLNQRIIQRLISPLLGVFVSLCTLIAVLAISLDFSPWIQCLIPHWIILSSAEFLFIQVYAFAGLYVTRQINLMANDDTCKKKLKIHLWSVIGAYEFSAFVTLIYYTVLQIWGDEIIGCSGIFGHVSEYFSLIYTTVMIIKYLFPIWIMILIFQPTRGYLSIEESFGRSLDTQEQLIYPNPVSTTLSEPIPSIPTDSRNSASSPTVKSLSCREASCFYLICGDNQRSTSNEQHSFTNSAAMDVSPHDYLNDDVACHQPNARSGHNKGNVLQVNMHPHEDGTCSEEGKDTSSDEYDTCSEEE